MPQIPDPPTDCTPGTQYVLVFICGQGITWQVANSLPPGAVIGSCAEAEKTKQALIEMAKELKWTPKELTAALKAL